MTKLCLISESDVLVLFQSASLKRLVLSEFRHFVTAAGNIATVTGIQASNFAFRVYL